MKDRSRSRGVLVLLAPSDLATLAVPAVTVDVSRSALPQLQRWEVRDREDAVTGWLFVAHPP